MIGNDWDILLKDFFNSDDFKFIYERVQNEYLKKEIYPPKELIFSALKLTSYANTRVVILGQDPYHGYGEAHGLAFSVQDGVKIPPSLKNIYKELYSDLGVKPRDNGNLTGWAKEGVLLLNTVLTVEKDKPASHKNIGWELMSDYIIKLLNLKKEPVVFILWGNFAKEKAKFITNPHHLILTSSHPSPFSAYSGFLGSKPFSKANDFLVNNGLKPIDWSK